MLSKIAVAALFASSAMAGDAYAAPAVAVTTTLAVKADVYYADYDNLLVVGKDQIYYQSALTPEAVERLKMPPAAAASWSPAKPVAVSANLYNLKGATFCGEQGAPAAGQNWDNVYGAKYKQVFVADEGDAAHAGQVIGWEVVEDPKNPAAIQLKNGWQVYAPEGAQPVDVECGPNNGLFIADKGNNAVRWITYDNLVAKAPKPKYAEVVPPECAAIVDNVRSLDYNEDAGKLSWSNNDQAVVENAGVFQYNAPAEAAPKKLVCDAAMCDAWAPACAPAVKKAVDAKAGEQVWAVADAWDQVQVSKGAAQVYDVAGKEVAAVDQQATYAEAAEDPKRDVLFVTDEKEGAVYAVAMAGAAPKEIGAVDNAYGVAYNDAYGWNGVADSASTVTLALGALLAGVALLL